MDIHETAEFNRPEEFRRWLRRNHKVKIELWLMFHNKASGQQTLTIAQAVEEALCYGWIQSRLKPIDGGRFVVRFSPRLKGSIWSPANLKRIRSLITQGKMTEFGTQYLPDDFKE
jgi:uncharacterized protein YdeI (YjbR/CyaY-like superfamily)